MKNILLGSIAFLVGAGVLGSVYYIATMDNDGQIKELKVDNKPQSTQNLLESKKTKEFVNMYGQGDQSLVPQSTPTLPDGNSKTLSVEEIIKKIQETRDRSSKAQMAYNLGMNYLGKIGDLNLIQDTDKAIIFLDIAFQNGEINAGYELVQIYTDKNDTARVDAYTQRINEMNSNQQ